jgi:hypothetical protein
LRRGKTVQRFVVCWMGRYGLSLQMGRKLRQGYASLSEDATDLVAVCIAFRGTPEIQEPRIPTRDLHTYKACLARPSSNSGQAVERRLVSRELRQEDRWPLSVFISSPSPICGRLAIATLDLAELACFDV